MPSARPAIESLIVNPEREAEGDPEENEIGPHGLIQLYYLITKIVQIVLFIVVLVVLLTKLFPMLGIG